MPYAAYNKPLKRYLKNMQVYSHLSPILQAI